MGRTAFCSGGGVKRGSWTADEDRKLTAYVQKHGERSWRSVPEKAGLQRCGKSCRLRWVNYLRPGIKRGDFTSEEDQIIIELHAVLGNRWAAIARHLRKRTDNEIKNYWNAHLKKRLANMGTDPVIHKPVCTRSSTSSSSSSSSSTFADSNNVAPMMHNGCKISAQESKSTPQSTPQREQLSRSSSSASVRLLNNLAARFTKLQYLESLRACLTMKPIPFHASVNVGCPNSSESTDISSCHLTSTVAAANTSSWLDYNTVDPRISPIDFRDNLPNTIVSPDSADGVNVDSTSLESEALSIYILESNPTSEPARSSNFSSSSNQNLNNMASKFASLHFIDELPDWQNNNISPGSTQGDDHTTTYTCGGGLSNGDLNVEDMVFDIDYTVRSPVFYNSNNLENYEEREEPVNLFNIP